MRMEMEEYITLLQKEAYVKKRIQKYTEDPSIGVEKVEKCIDAAQALSYQVPRYPVDYCDLKEEYEKHISKNIGKKDFDLDQIPPYPEYDILGFIESYGENLEDWQKDIISIVRDQAYYFMPQIRTKTMNEGYEICMLDLLA